MQQKTSTIPKHLQDASRPPMMGHFQPFKGQLNNRYFCDLLNIAEITGISISLHRSPVALSDLESGE